MSAVFVVAVNNIRRLLSDRSVLMYTVVLPLVLLVVIGRGTEDTGLRHFEIGIVGSGDVATRLEAADGLRVTEHFTDSAAARQAVKRQDVDAVVDTTASPIQLIVNPDNPSSTALQALVSSAIDSALRPRTAARALGDGSLEANARDLAPLLREPTLEVTVSGDPNSDLDGVEYQAPAQVVLFMFITSLAASGMLITSRQLGVTARQLASPVRARYLLIGEGAGRFVIALGQGLFIVGVSSLLFGVGWGDPFAAAAVMILFAAVATGVALIAGSVLRSPETASAVGPIAGIGMGMLGGCMWPLEIVGAPMRMVGHLTPHAWAMDAWIKISVNGAGVTDLVPELSVLALMAAALGFIGARKLRAAAQI